MERFMAIFVIGIYISMLSGALWFAFHVIKSGKMEAEKDIEMPEIKRPKDANDNIN